MKPRIAVSIGDLNGIGVEIALKTHKEISKICHPLYCVDYDMLLQAAKKLQIDIPKNFDHTYVSSSFEIKPGQTTKEAGAYSFASFKKAIDLTKVQDTKAVVTLPINKEAWMKAGLPYKGHTEVLRDIFKKDAIMMLGCEKLFVSLYTEHIPLKDVPAQIDLERLTNFLLTFHKEVKADRIAVLGLNPHAGDHGVLGNEENIIEKAIAKANEKIAPTGETFYGPLVPDIAFSPKMREQFTYYVAMYHDQGLGPLKALYFDESINVSLNLPIIRTSVDHGTAFDIAYLKGRKLNTKSYMEAVKMALRMMA